MKKIKKYFLIIAFISIILLVLFATILKQYSQISVLENRTLASLPAYSKEDLMSGKYFSDWETFFIDQIYGRSHWIKGYTFLNMNILGKRNINYTLIEKDGYLLPFIPYERVYYFDAIETSMESMTQNMSALQEYLKGSGAKFLFVGVPEQSSYLRDKYSKYYNNDDEFFLYNEKTMFEKCESKGINYINMNYEFALEGRSDYYFKTDHHYSFRGAYKTYTEIINKLINELNVKSIRGPLKENEFNIITLPNPILGSRNRQLANLYPTDEKIEIAYQKEEVEYIKITNGYEDPGFYKISEDPKERPSYAVYMGGDKSEAVITTNRPELPNLLLFGDSFTNAVEPLLYYHFNETRILDLRFYDDKSLYEYIDEYHPDIVIMLRDDLSYYNLTGNGEFD